MRKITLDGLNDFLLDNSESISPKIIEELEIFGDITHSDEAYALADLIRNKKSAGEWAVYKDSNNCFITLISNRSEINRSIYDIVNGSEFIQPISKIEISNLVLIE